MTLDRYANLDGQSTANIAANAQKAANARMRRTLTQAELDSARTIGVSSQTAPAISAVAFGAGTYVKATTGTVTITFNKNVTVGAGAKIKAHHTSGDTVTAFDMTCAAGTSQAGSANFTATLPNAVGTLTIPTQSIDGSVVDAASGNYPANKVLTLEHVDDAGTASVTND